MSSQVSPDGMYYWNGTEWVSTLSPDGSHRWNGTAWLPVLRQGYVPPSYLPPERSPRVATSWTRPLQYAVAAYLSLSVLFSLTLPFWMGSVMSQSFNQAIQNQILANPEATPPPADFVNSMSSMMTGVVWFVAVFAVLIGAVGIYGALKRWTWLYYVVLVLLGIGVLSLPSTLIRALTGSDLTSSTGATLTVPSWFSWASVATGVPGAALFVWMLIALIKRGPWGMTRSATS